jgi:uncharacterized coiled-coil DUF342 family protein
MVKRSKHQAASEDQQRRQFLRLIRDLRQRFDDINHKLDHLIRSYRRFFITSDFAHSSPSEFDD